MKNNNLLLLALVGAGLYYFSRRTGTVNPPTLPAVNPAPGLPAEVPNTATNTQGGYTPGPGRVLPDTRFDSGLRGRGRSDYMRTAFMVS